MSACELSPKQTHTLAKMLRNERSRSPKSILRKASMEVVGKDWLPPTGSPRRSKKTNKTQYDRYIPDRNAMNIPSSQFNLSRKENDRDQLLDDESLTYQEEVAKACGLALDKRILAFKAEPPSAKKEDLRALYSRPLKTNNLNYKRKIPTTPERILDAPGIVDNYYLNLLDWSCVNVLAIGLDSCVYLWNADNANVSCLKQSNTDEKISGLGWTQDGSYLAIGTSEGDCQIWDVERGAKLRSMKGHQSRVPVVAWDKHVVSSGCRDGSIWHHDVRVANHKVAELISHSAEVCGLKWRPDGQFLASGGNDNLLNIWDARSSNPRYSKSNHTAAVKALAWCPWQNSLLASGGGSYDRNIHFWNITTGARLNSVDTGSQVTSIIWSPENKELLSTHGYPDNHISLWTYPGLAKIIDIPAHESRVLYSALSPDGQTVATAAGDENLKFWKIFESKPKAMKPLKDSAFIHSRTAHFR